MRKDLQRMRHYYYERGNAIINPFLHNGSHRYAWRHRWWCAKQNNIAKCRDTRVANFDRTECRVYQRRP